MGELQSNEDGALESQEEESDRDNDDSNGVPNICGSGRGLFGRGNSQNEDGRVGFGGFNRNND